MSTKDYSAKLLEMEGVRIENLEESEKEIFLQISLERRTQICSHCGAETERVHDYRIRQVHDLELRWKPLRLLYRRRWYVCPVCGKRFAEQNTFVGRYIPFQRCQAARSAGDIGKRCMLGGNGNRRLFQYMDAIFRTLLSIPRKPVVHAILNPFPRCCRLVSVAISTARDRTSCSSRTTICCT